MDLDVIKRQEPIFLPKSKDGGYICPFCGNGSHGKKGTGIKRIPGNVRFHCFECGFTGSVIDLFGQAFGITDNRQMIWQCVKYYEEEGRCIYNVPVSTPASGKSKAQFDFTNYYNHLRVNRTPYSGTYLQKRGISKPLQDDVDILYDAEWRNPVSVQKAKDEGRDSSLLPTSPRIIIPNGPNGYLARDTRDEQDLTDMQKKYVKQNAGVVSIYSPRELNCDRPVYVVEGQIDCLSILQASGQAIALCGIANVKRFVEEYAQKLKNFHLNIMLDMDETGRKAQKKLAKLLEEEGISYTFIDYPHHDPNDFLVADPKGFSQFVAKYNSFPVRDLNDEW